MAAFEQELENRLRELEEQNLRRRLRRLTSPQQPRAVVDGRAVLNFSSNDYLGLATHPRLKEAAARAIRDFGTGAGASRLVCGSLDSHEELEETLADFKGTQSALAFSTGYATALGAITSLLSGGDVVVIDKLVHASIVDAARLSGAKLRVFKHNDLSDLEEILKWCDQHRSTRAGTQVLVVTESLFSMDGDVAPLREMVELKERFGAWLMVDEAHATGLFGPCRRGLLEESGVSEHVEVQMGTLGKALGSAGGYITGSRTLREFLMNRARSFIYSTAPPPAVCAAAMAGVEVVRSDEGPELLGKLRSNLKNFLDGSAIKVAEEHSPIVPWLAGEESAAMKLSARLLEQGIFVPAIRYPTVPRGKARLRFTLSAAHQQGDIVELLRVLKAETQS